MKKALIILVLCFAAFSAAGCITRTESQPLPVPTPGITPVATILPPQVNVTVAHLTRYYKVEGGCYYGAQLEITNRGGNAATNLAIQFNLVDARTGSARDKENLLIERIAPGERKVFSIDFDGDCSREYGIRAEIF